MIYIDLNLNKANLLSSILYRLTRPNSVRNPTDVSTMLFEVQQNPANPLRGLMLIPDTYTLNLHAALDPQEVYDALNGLVPNAQRDLIVSRCVAGATTLRQLLPDALWNTRVTKAEAIALGYIV